MPDAPGDPTAPSLEGIARRVRAYWEATGVPARSLAGRPDGPPFRFTEGPPTANGVPHIGHAAARTLKDVALRFRRMTGHRIVTSMAGWDCHGLPVELEVERRLGLRSKREIEAYGVARFCDECRRSVFASVDVWREMSQRLGYWLDYDHAYATMQPAYIESVWWSLKTLHDRHLLEKGDYVLPYCPRCETPLSSHEVAQGYRDTTDPSVTVRFRLRPRPGAPADDPPRYLLVWTTTPWTLPANLLIAARGDLAYVGVRAPDGGVHLLAESALPRYQAGAEIVERHPGAALAGLEYEPLFPFAGPGPGRYRVVLDEMVEAAEGTGLVHIAPSYGPDDQRIGAREGVGRFDPLDSRAHFLPTVPPVAGKAFKAADAVLLEALAASGALVHRGTVTHTYPFCWRCGSALLYRAIDSWFVRTSRFTDRLVAHNATVAWVPRHLRDGRFGNFLTEAKDWALSRNRYWGTPLPIWVCPAGHATCIGSFGELAERTGGPLPDGFDPHRMGVDPIHFPCPTCGAETAREPYTIDGWYDSGCAPFAQYHYPFEPGPFLPERPLDYVAEGLDQTRGWFYTLLVLATALFDRPAYATCVVNGLVLDEGGQKMSKSRGNVVDPMTLLERLGGDAVRWAFVVTDFTEPMRIGETTVRQLAARTLGTAAHATAFYAENARAVGRPPATAAPSPAGLLDRWILARLDATVELVTESLSSSDPRPGAVALREFVDDLSTWYLRRSRPRFWSDTPTTDRDEAFDTLSFTLATLARLFAPYAPFLAEHIHQTVLGDRWDDAEASVHRCSWPRPAGRADPALDAAMAELRHDVEVGRELRQRAKVKSRVPLPAFLRVADPPPGYARAGPEALGLVAAELNVGEYRLIPPAEAPADDDPEYVSRAEADRPRWFLARTPSPAMLREGRVRETLRRLQAMRKEARLRFDDRVRVELGVADELRAILAPEEARLRRELLAESIAFFATLPPGDPPTEWEADGDRVQARLLRVPDA